MTQYRRNFIPGGSFFFTVNLADRRLRLLTDHVELLRDAFRYVLARHPFTVDAIVARAVTCSKQGSPGFGVPLRGHASLCPTCASGSN